MGLITSFLSYNTLLHWGTAHFSTIAHLILVPELQQNSSLGRNPPPYIGTNHPSPEVQPEVGKVTVKSNGDEALNDEFLLKSNGDEALNHGFP